MMLTDPVLHECLDQWPAWQITVSYALPPTEPSTASPHDVDQALQAMSLESLGRLTHPLVGHACADTIDEAVQLLHEVWEMAARGHRPRYGTEAGLSFGRPES